MSFSKVISIFAGLGSIFAVSLTAYKLSQDNQNVPDVPEQSAEIQTEYENRITELQQQVSGLQQQLVNTNPPTPVKLPEPSTLKPEQPPVAPPLPAPPAPENGNFE